MPSSATSPVAWPYALLADAVLVLHTGIVLFVVGGLLLVVLGNWRGWPWVNRPWFRLAHLAAITVVVAESWLGLTCPLTTLEWWLRARAGVAPYESSFIAHWLQTLLFYAAPKGRRRLSRFAAAAASARRYFFSDASSISTA